MERRVRRAGAGGWKEFITGPTVPPARLNKPAVDCSASLIYMYTHLPFLHHFSRYRARIRIRSFRKAVGTVCHVTNERAIFFFFGGAESIFIWALSTMQSSSLCIQRFCSPNTMATDVTVFSAIVAVGVVVHVTSLLGFPLARSLARSLAHSTRPLSLCVRVRPRPPTPCRRRRRRRRRRVYRAPEPFCDPGEIGSRVT